MSKHKPLTDQDYKSGALALSELLLLEHAPPCYDHKNGTCDYNAAKPCATKKDCWLRHVLAWGGGTSDLEHVRAIDAEIDRLGAALKEAEAKQTLYRINAGYYKQDAEALARELAEFGICPKCPSDKEICPNHERGHGCKGGKMGQNCHLDWAKNKRGARQ